MGRPSHAPASVRVTEQIDMSTTVKFVYVYFSGEGVPFTKRGRMGVVHGNVRKHFQVRAGDVPWTEMRRPGRGGRVPLRGG